MLGQRIKELRINLNMTQEELAYKVGFKTKGAISRVENGTRDLDQKQIALFAKVLNVSPSYLLGWDISHIKGPKQMGIEERNNVAHVAEQPSLYQIAPIPIYQDEDFTLLSDTRTLSQGAEPFLRKNLLSMTDEKRPSREYMLTWLRDNIRTAADIGGNYEDMDDEELYNYYSDLRETIEDE